MMKILPDYVEIGTNITLLHKWKGNYEWNEGVVVRIYDINSYWYINVDCGSYVVCPSVDSILKIYQMDHIRDLGI